MKPSPRNSFPTRHSSLAAPRAQVMPDHQVLFREFQPENRLPVPLALANISISGVGMLRNCREEWPEQGRIVAGEMAICGMVIPAELKAVHLSPTVVGFQFNKNTRALGQAIHERFVPEFSALGLSRVAPENLHSDGKTIPHWFNSKEGNELYYLLKCDRIVEFHASFGRQFVEGGDGTPLRSGHIRRPSALYKLEESQQSDQDFSWEATFNENARTSTERFISNVPGLYPAHREALLRILS